MADADLTRRNSSSGRSTVVRIFTYKHKHGSRSKSMGTPTPRQELKANIRGRLVRTPINYATDVCFARLVQEQERTQKTFGRRIRAGESCRDPAFYDLRESGRSSNLY